MAKGDSKLYLIPNFKCSSAHVNASCERLAPLGHIPLVLSVSFYIDAQNIFVITQREIALLHWIMM